jgi:hypothetical protein
MNETMLGQIILFLTTISGFAYQIYKENRKRRWEVEDRAALAVKVEEVKQNAAVAHDELVHKIEENTSISANAFNVANHVNEKIAKLTRLFTEVQDDAKDVAQVSKDVRADVGARLDKLEEKPKANE